MTKVCVDRDVLAALLDECWRESDYGWGITRLLSTSPIVTLACEAGLPIPGPLVPGEVPPAPPPYMGRLTAATYRDATDGRLRCTECGKVVYGNHAQAGKATAAMADRQALRVYIGKCGHYHLSRTKKP